MGQGRNVVSTKENKTPRNEISFGELAKHSEKTLALSFVTERTKRTMLSWKYPWQCHVYKKNRQIAVSSVYFTWRNVPDDILIQIHIPFRTCRSGGGGGGGGGGVCLFVGRRGVGWSCLSRDQQRKPHRVERIALCEGIVLSYDSYGNAETAVKEFHCHFSTHWGRYKMAANLKTTYKKSCSCVEFVENYHLIEISPRFPEDQ